MRILFRLFLAATVVLALAGGAILASHRPSSRSWTLTLDYATAGELAAGEAALRRIQASFTRGDWAEVAFGSTTTTDPGGAVTVVRESRTTWLGEVDGLRSLRVDVSERDAVVPGPEIVVTLSAPMHSEDDENRFRLLADRVRRVADPR